MATAEIHQALHRAQPFARIADGTLDAEGYGAVLQLLYRYHGSMAAVCEEGAMALELPVLAVAQRARLDALKTDLAYLALVPLSLPPPTRGQGDAYGAGCLYTVQGSTLGGKVIFRQLDYLLPDERGRLFFKGGRQDGAHWQALCAGLEKYRQGAHLADMTQGARDAFAHFERLLEN